MVVSANLLLVSPGCAVCIGRGASVLKEQPDREGIPISRDLSTISRVTGKGFAEAQFQQRDRTSCLHFNSDADSPQRNRFYRRTTEWIRSQDSDIDVEAFVPVCCSHRTNRTP